MFSPIGFLAGWSHGRLRRPVVSTNTSHQLWEGITTIMQQDYTNCTQYSKGATSRKTQPAPDNQEGGNRQPRGGCFQHLCLDLFGCRAPTKRRRGNSRLRRRKRRFPSVISYMVSLGQGFLDEFISADDGHRRHLFRFNAPEICNFLPSALEHSSGTLPNTTPPEGGFADDSSHPNRGWFDFSKPTYTNYLKIWDLAPSPLRLCGYVFWDSKGTLHLTIDEALIKADEPPWEEPRKLYSPYMGSERRGTT
ncbi:hypothetical protein BJ170DRAFT_197886 [Xylariales sp. AK1849]|nr:hypothetical protein BJ170DRAFT_197886 [Xylariales sp. AK1849]